MIVSPGIGVRPALIQSLAIDPIDASAESPVWFLKSATTMRAPLTRTRRTTNRALGGEPLGQQARHGRGQERQRARQHLVQGDTEGVLVGPAVDRAIGNQLLRAHVRRCPHRHADPGLQVGIVDGEPGPPCQAEISQDACPPSSRMFSGLASRCTKSSPWAYASASAISRAYRTASATGIGPRSRRALTDSPLAGGISGKRPPSLRGQRPDQVRCPASPVRRRLQPRRHHPSGHGGGVHDSPFCCFTPNQSSPPPRLSNAPMPPAHPHPS